MKKKLTIFMYSGLILLLMITQSAIGHGGEPIQGDYSGSTIVVPYNIITPVMDGERDTNVFTTNGLITIESLEANLYLSNNGTFLFAYLVYEGNGSAGFGIKSGGDHEEASPTVDGEVLDFTYIFGSVSNATVVAGVYLSDSDFGTTQQVSTPEFYFNVVALQNATHTMLEFMIETAPPHDDPDGHGLLTQDTAYNIVVVIGDAATLPPANVSILGVIPAFNLREGDDANRIATLLENRPNWVHYILFPALLLLTSGVTTYIYWPKNKKVIKNEN